MARFVLVVVLFAAAVYLVMWALERRRASRSGGGTGRGRSRPQPRQVAPDDDEDFLRWLERKRRKDTEEGDPQA